MRNEKYLSWTIDLSSNGSKSQLSFSKCAHLVTIVEFLVYSSVTHAPEDTMPGNQVQYSFSKKDWDCLVCTKQLFKMKQSDWVTENTKVESSIAIIITLNWVYLFCFTFSNDRYYKKQYYTHTHTHILSNRLYFLFPQISMRKLLLLLLMSGIDLYNTIILIVQIKKKFCYQS